MGRETSHYVVGDWWLDKRRDGRSTELSQITSYDTETRSISYWSTRRRSLDEAKSVIHAHVKAMRARAPQIASSIRVFIGFLMEDEVGLGAKMGAQLRAGHEAFLAGLPPRERKALTQSLGGA